MYDGGMKVSLSSDHVKYHLEYFDGNKIESWTMNGQLHSVNDQPGWISNDGEEIKWFVHGKLHRDEFFGPAYIRKPQEEYYYFNNGSVHRSDGPAIITYNSKNWLQRGVRHRLDGPAIEWTNGSREWWKANNRHRPDGPALYRQDESGMIDPTSCLWYLHDDKYSFNEWLKKTPLDEEQKLMLKLIYG